MALHSEIRYSINVAQNNSKCIYELNHTSTHAINWGVRSPQLKAAAIFMLSKEYNRRRAGTLCLVGWVFFIMTFTVIMRIARPLLLVSLSLYKLFNYRSVKQFYLFVCLFVWPSLNGLLLCVGCAFLAAKAVSDRQRYHACSVRWCENFTLPKEVCEDDVPA